MSAGQVPLYSCCDIKYEISGRKRVYDLLKKNLLYILGISHNLNLCAEHRSDKIEQAVKKN